jgi:1-acyl-sn-glycerol-3-phosphate acyltransferase
VWGRAYLNRFLRFLTRHLIAFDCHGIERIPRKGRLIVYINHINFLDPVLACALVPRDVVPLSKEENLHHPLIGPLARAYGVIPIRRGEADLNAFRSALAVLEADRALLVAPEGTRSGHGRLQQAKDGLTRMALRTNSPLIPIGLVGQETFKSRLSKLRRTRVSVWVGRPFRFIVPDGLRVRREEMREMTSEAMGELALLLPPEHRGFYAGRELAPRRYITFDGLPYESLAAAVG